MGLDIDYSKDGYKILRVEVNGKKKYVGSKYNQKREIDNFINSFGQISIKDNFIILGLSFGEHIKELIKTSGKDSKILIVEFNNELIDYCKNDEKAKFIFEDKRISLITTDKDIREFFYNNIDEGNINFLKIDTYCKYANIFWNEFSRIHSLIKEEVLRITLNRNTVLINGDMYLKNLLKNVKYIAKSTEINVLKNKYKNQPAIIVSAGPSLSKNIHLLKNVNNSLILSGGRTVKALLEKGIQPSFVGIVDPKEESYKLVEGFIDKVEYPLYFNDATPTNAIKEHHGKKFFSLQNNFLNNALNMEVPSLYGGGSIAHSLTKVALYMGCSPIVFIGQDLAYTDEREHDISSRSPWDSPTYRFYSREDDIYVDDVFGNKVRTSLQLNTYRISLEKIISENKEIKFINATEGGANINGAINKTLIDVINEFDNTYITPINNYLISEDKTAKIINYLENTLLECDKYKELCTEGRKVLEKYKINYCSNRISQLEKYERKFNIIHSQIQNKLQSIIVLNAGLSKVIYEVEGNSDFVILIKDREEERFRKTYNKTMTLYSNLQKVIENNYNKIKDLIDELKTEA